MLRKLAQSLPILPAALSVRPIQHARLFSTSKVVAQPCWSGPSAEQERAEEISRLQGIAIRRQQEVLLCKLGSIFYRHDEVIKSKLFEHLSTSEQATIVAAKLHHQVHRRHEHLELIEKTHHEFVRLMKELEQLKHSEKNLEEFIKKQQTALNLPPLTKEDLDKLLPQYRDIISKEITKTENKIIELGQSLEKLKAIDVSSTRFLYETEYQNEAAAKLKK